MRQSVRHEHRIAPRRGRFLVVDGTDGSGKTTQIVLLTRRLRHAGHRVAVVDFPDYRRFFGRLVRRMLDGEFGRPHDLNPYLASLLFAGDRWQHSAVITHWLESGVTVLANRYVSANMIHQGAKVPPGAARRRLIAWLKELEFTTYGFPQPDRVVFLDVPPGVAQRLVLSRQRQTGKGDRADRDRMHQTAAHQTARWLAAHERRWQRIPCTERGRILSPDIIHERVWQALQPALR